METLALLLLEIIMDYELFFQVLGPCVPCFILMAIIWGMCWCVWADDIPKLVHYLCVSFCLVANIMLLSLLVHEYGWQYVALSFLVIPIPIIIPCMIWGLKTRRAKVVLKRTRRNLFNWLEDV